jgi:putative phosphoribosyl transferase
MLFQDRADAGRRLASSLQEFAQRPDVLVLALPRGGVPVGYEVARALHAPLDVFVVRKLGVPWEPELAMGAIASGGTLVVNPEVVRGLGISDEQINRVAALEEQELETRERLYRGDRPPLDVKGKTVILVDDGLATGSSIRAAAQALRARGPARVMIAVPVAASQTCAELRAEGNEVFCAATPEPFLAVSQWYREFTQTSDAEVRELLQRAAQQLVVH